MTLTRTEVSKLYVAIFNRASEGEGNKFWQNTGLNTIETANEMLATSDAEKYFGSSLDSNQAFIEHIYANTLNKTIQDDAEGISYWVSLLDQGASRGEVVVGLIDAVSKYENSDNPVTKAAYDQFMNRVSVSNYMAQEVEKTPDEYAQVTGFDRGLTVSSEQISVADAYAKINDLADEDPIQANNNNVVTLRKVVDETVTVTTSEETTTYWGGPNGEKITLDSFYEMVRIATGQDIFELADSAINIDAQTALTNVTLVAQDNDSDATGDYQVNFTTATGEQFTTELALAQEHYKFLDSLIYYTDAQGNKVSRFSTETQTSETKQSTFGLATAILTPNVNNGATWENAMTTAGDDLIVAGQTELLHGAYIDGGEGVNTLEVSMKGVYAQPIQLLNIQNVLVENLPNVYADYYDLTSDAHADGYDIPDYLNITTATSNNAIAQAAVAQATAAQAAAAQQVNALRTALDAALANNESNDNSAQGSGGAGGGAGNPGNAGGAGTGTGTDGQDVSGSQTVEGLRKALEDAQSALEIANNNLANANAEAAKTAAVLVQAQNLVNSESILDLSNAREIENLVITEGINTGGPSEGPGANGIQKIGDLTVVGVRNGAKLSLEGSFFDHPDSNVNRHINVYYSQGLKDGLDVRLNLGEVGSNIRFNLFHNSNTVNIDSVGGGNVLASTNLANATLLALNISGNAQLVIANSISEAFTGFHPAVIDASTNTAGVDLRMAAYTDEVIFTGTLAADDHFNADSNQDKVVINGGDGNNEFSAANGVESQITSGNGKNEINVDDTATSMVTVGDGDNIINADDASISTTIKAGNGDNTIDADGGNIVSIMTGNGNNSITADSNTGSVMIQTGSGDDSIQALNGIAVEINAGDGNNSVLATANTSLTVTTGSGNDTVTIAGEGEAFGQADTALVDINLGDGENTLVIGLDAQADIDSDPDGDTPAGFDVGGLTALAGSEIAGSNITLDVNKDSNLSRATISGVTAVSLDNGTDLTISAEQFLAIGASNFSVDGVAFGQKATLTLVVTESMNFNALGITGDTFACDDINLNIQLACKGTAENVFTLTAEQLDTYIADDGILVDTNSDYDNNQVVVTNAGLSFDAFASTGGGTVDDTVGRQDVTVIRNVDGFERPTEDDYVDQMIINTDNDLVPAEIGDASTLLDTLVVEGSKDLNTDVNLGDNFTVDFHALTGVANLTVSQFEDITEGNDSSLWGEIIGNGNARVNIEVTNGATVGQAGITDGGFKSSGVSTYVVTEILNDAAGSEGEALSQATATSATIFVCDQTKDLKVIGMQNLRNSTITYEQVNWGTEILLEGDGFEKSSEQQKNLGDPDKSEVGSIVAKYFEPGANATVRITNQGKELGMNEDAESGYDATGERILEVESITIENADKLKLIVEDGDAVIETLSAEGVEHITVSGPEDVTVPFSDAAFDNNSNVKTIDASGVLGKFTLVVTADSDLSDVTLTDVDAIVLQGTNNAAVSLTLSADQAMTLGSVISDTNDNSTLNVNDFSTQALDLSSIEVSNIGTVTTADVDGTIIVDPAVNFGDADELIITALTSDTTLQMTADQFHTYCGDTLENGLTIIGCQANSENDATLRLTNISADEVIDLTTVDQDEDANNGNVRDAVDVTLVLDGITATKEMIIADGEVTLEISGNNDLTMLNDPAALAGNTNANAAATIVDVNFTADATLTLTAQQIVDIEAAYQAANPGATDSAFSAIAGANVTINVTDLSTQALDLNLIQAAGITIGTVSIENTDNAITLDADTTFGGATQIITPTADTTAPEYGTEQTTVTMTVAQFESSAGTITGDSQINLTGLADNKDTDSDYKFDVLDIDLSNIANAGTITLDDPDDVVTLADTANLGAFTIHLANGELIRFATESQASAKIDVDAGDVTGVQWLWTTFTSEVDTSGYDGDITTLFIDEALLVSKPTEEDLWSLLDGNIVVEKVNGDTIPSLIQFNRTNTFEALSNITAGVNYDDSAEFSTVANLTMNLEGEVNIASVLVGDTKNGNGSTPNIDDKGFLKTLTINSYLDTSTIEGYDPNAVSGINLAKNTIGNISLNAGSVDELVDVTINTYGDDADGVANTADDQFSDADNVNDDNAVAELRDGLAIETGDIVFAAKEANTTAKLTLTGSENITINDVDISDANTTRLDIDMTGIDTAVLNGEQSTQVVIGGAKYSHFDIDNDNDNADQVAVDFVHVLDNYSPDASASAVLGANGNTVLVDVTNGTNDLTNVTTNGVDAIHVSGNATITLTDQQIRDIGESNFTVAAGVTVTLNVTELSDGSNIDLNTIQSAGFNIGTITTADADVTLADTASLGGADNVVVLLNNDDRTLTLTAEQYQQTSGVITENDTNATTANKAGVTITDLVTAIPGIGIGTKLDNPNDDDRQTVNIDLSTIATTGAHKLDIADDNYAADVTIDSTSNLSDFTVELDDIDSTAVQNELAGQTIRFTTAVQAERAIDVVGFDPALGENDTNVVWDFSTISGTTDGTTVDTSRYDGELGRLWISDVLVTNQNDLEDLFSASDLNGNLLDDDVNLHGSIIVRIVNTQDLNLINSSSIGVSRTVEVEAFTDLSANGLVFDEQDQLVDIDNLTLDLGGEVNLGNLVIDNIIKLTNTNLDSDQFGVLTINSKLANGANHYLMPEDWVAGTNVLPANGANNGLNIINDISAGPTRGELADVVVNADDVGVQIHTIFFAEDDAASTANFTVNGDNNVVVKSLDTSDAEITVLNIDNNLLGGATLTVTGGSPAAVVTNTEQLVVNTVAGSTTTFGSNDTSDNVGVYAGVYGPDLSAIVIGGEGTTNLGTIAQIDGTVDAATGNGFILDVDNDSIFTATLGSANVNGVDKAPELAAGEKWMFQVSSADTNSALTITEDVTFGAGEVSFVMGDAELIISGKVDLTALTDVAYSNTAGKIILDEAESILLMTDEQWNTNGLTDADFTDPDGNPAILEVTAELIAEIGSDLTNVRGYSEYNIANGLDVTLREDQADVSKVYDANGVLGVAGDLSDAGEVTVFVQETGFGNQDITNLQGVDKLILEEDTTGTPPTGYSVTVTVEQASSLAGDIEKHNNNILAQVDSAMGDLTDPAGDGSVPPLDLSEVDILDLAGDVVMNKTQFAVPNIQSNGNDIILKDSGDLSGINMNDAATGHEVHELIITGDTTITAEQESILSAVTESAAPVAHTLTINELEALGTETVVGDATVPNTFDITIDFDSVTVATIAANWDTKDSDGLGGIWTLDNASKLNGANIALTGGGEVNANVDVVNNITITGTNEEVNLTDANNELNGNEVHLENIAVAIAGTLSLTAASALDVNTDLGSFVVTTSGGLLTGTVDQLAGRDVSGAGAVTVTQLGDTAADLSTITVTGVKTAQLEDADVTIDAGTNLGDFAVEFTENAGVLNISAAQASDINFIAEATGADEEVVNVTGLENALDADLSDLNSAAFQVNVTLDTSAGNVQIASGADLSNSTAATGSAVTITGTNIASIGDESANGAADGPVVNTTKFVVETGAVLESDLSNNDGNSIVDATNVSGNGTLRFIAEDNGTVTLSDTVQNVNVVINDDDAGITINDLEAGAYTYDTTLVGAHTLDLNESLATNDSNAVTGYEQLATGAITDTTGLVVYTGNNLTSANEAGIEDLFDTTTSDLAFNAGGAAGDQIYLIAGDGTDSYLFLITDTDNDDEFVEANDTAVLVATLTGVTDTADFIAANFVDFS